MASHTHLSSMLAAWHAQHFFHEAKPPFLCQLIPFLYTIEPMRLFVLGYHLCFLSLHSALILHWPCLYCLLGLPALTFFCTACLPLSLYKSLHTVHIGRGAHRSITTHTSQLCKTCLPFYHSAWDNAKKLSHLHTCIKHWDLKTRRRFGWVEEEEPTYSHCCMAHTSCLSHMRHAYFQNMPGWWQLILA